MVHVSLLIFNWILMIFGVGKPYLKPKIIRTFSALWSLMIAIIIVICYLISYKDSFSIDFPENLEQVSSINDMVVNAFVVLINVFDGDNTCQDIYENVKQILYNTHVKDTTSRLIVLKILIWLSIPITVFLVLIILEIVKTDTPFVLLSRIPTFLCITHLITIIYVLLAALKILTFKLSEMLPFEGNISAYLDPKDLGKTIQTLKYLFDPEIRFIEVNQRNYMDVKFLCRLYDRIVTCVHLLEKYHGMQILLIIWLMFSSAVFGITLISSNQAKFPWLVIAKSMLPFIWCFIACYIQGQVHKEVEQIEILIIKYMIDYRCDSSRNSMLQIFKQLVNTNRLQFTACNLFHLNYSMLLSAIMNIITYSIILIQLLNQ